jgi:hypothetical protein
MMMRLHRQLALGVGIQEGDRSQGRLCPIDLLRQPGRIQRSSGVLLWIQERVQALVGPNLESQCGHVLGDGELPSEQGATVVMDLDPEGEKRIGAMREVAHSPRSPVLTKAEVRKGFLEVHGRSIGLQG